MTEQVTPKASVAAHTAAADPHTGYQRESEKGAANGYAPLNANSRVPIANLASGTPDGTKFVRDDGTLAVPTAGATVAVQDDTVARGNSSTLDFGAGLQVVQNGSTSTIAATGLGGANPIKNAVELAIPFASQPFDFDNQSTAINTALMTYGQLELAPGKWGGNGQTEIDGGYQVGAALMVPGRNGYLGGRGAIAKLVARCPASLTTLNGAGVTPVEYPMVQVGYVEDWPNRVTQAETTSGQSACTIENLFLDGNRNGAPHRAKIIGVRVSHRTYNGDLTLGGLSWGALPATSTNWICSPGTVGNAIVRNIRVDGAFIGVDVINCNYYDVRQIRAMSCDTGMRWVQADGADGFGGGGNVDCWIGERFEFWACVIGWMNQYNAAPVTIGDLKVKWLIVKQPRPGGIGAGMFNETGTNPTGRVAAWTVERFTIEYANNCDARRVEQQFQKQTVLNQYWTVRGRSSAIYVASGNLFEGSFESATNGERVFSFLDGYLANFRPDKGSQTPAQSFYSCYANHPDARLQLEDYLLGGGVQYNIDKGWWPKRGAYADSVRAINWDGSCTGFDRMRQNATAASDLHPSWNSQTPDFSQSTGGVSASNSFFVDPDTGLNHTSTRLDFPATIVGTRHFPGSADSLFATNGRVVNGADTATGLASGLNMAALTTKTVSLDYAAPVTATGTLTEISSGRYNYTQSAAEKAATHCSYVFGHGGVTVAFMKGWSLVRGGIAQFNVANSQGISRFMRGFASPQADLAPLREQLLMFTIYNPNAFDFTFQLKLLSTTNLHLWGHQDPHVIDTTFRNWDAGNDPGDRWRFGLATYQHLTVWAGRAMTVAMFTPATVFNPNGGASKDFKAVIVPWSVHSGASGTDPLNTASGFSIHVTDWAYVNSLQTDLGRTNEVFANRWHR